MNQAKTEAEAFMKLQEAANANLAAIQQDFYGTTEEKVALAMFAVQARETALPKLTLEVVAENERLRKVLRDVRNLLVLPPSMGSGSGACGHPYDLQRIIDQALQEPSR